MGQTSTLIIGCNGSDVIEGTPATDTLKGDDGGSDDCPNGERRDGDDILLAMAIQDQTEILVGGNGFNRYVPGYGQTNIQGGENLDVVSEIHSEQAMLFY